MTERQPNFAIIGLIPGILITLLALMPVQSARCAVTTGGILRLATNYDYRGYTKSDDNPTIQLNIDGLHSSGVFLGTWISAIDIDGADYEINPYLGMQFELSSDWQLVAALAGYIYGEQVMGQNTDYAEAMVQLAYGDTGSIRLHVAPDYFGTSSTVVNYELELRYPLSNTVEASGSLGYQASRDALNYDIVHGNVGVAWYILPNLTLDLRYHESHETNERPHDEHYPELSSNRYLDAPVIFSVSLGF